MSTAGNKRPASSLDSNDAATAAGEPGGSAARRVQPRHFHAGWKPPHSGDPTAPAASNQRPVSTSFAQLHRHAVEALFAFLTLRELGKFCSVSKAWYAAVLNLRPVGADATTKTAASFTALLSSPLRRHVAHLQTYAYYGPHSEDSALLFLSASDIAQITVRLPHLPSLDSKLAAEVVPPTTTVGIAATTASLQLPPLLRRICFGWHKDVCAPQMNANLQSLVSLTHLTIVKLDLSAPGISLAPLRQIASLRSLSLSHSRNGDPSDLLDIPVLRQLSQLEHLSLTPFDDEAMTAPLLSPPLHLHRLQFFGDYMNPLRPTAADASLLACLAHLTQLHLVIDDAAATDCLRALPKITDLDLCYHDDEANAPAMERMLANVATCRKMTRLQLCSDVEYDGVAQHITSKQLVAVLVEMPLLSDLYLRHLRVDSLSFLSCGSLSRTLTSLDLSVLTPLLAHPQLMHFGALKALKSLQLEGVLRKPLESFARTMLTPPWSNSWLPALKTSHIHEAYMEHPM